MTEEGRVVQRWWDALQARDWAAARSCLAEHLLVRWPHTGEIFRGADNFVAVQSEYPEGWSIRVINIYTQGQTVVSEVEVPQVDVGIFRAVSLWQVEGGKIVAATEYWVELGGEAPPVWRNSLGRVLLSEF